MSTDLPFLALDKKLHGPLTKRSPVRVLTTWIVSSHRAVLKSGKPECQKAEILKTRITKIKAGSLVRRKHKHKRKSTGKGTCEPGRCQHSSVLFASSLFIFKPSLRCSRLKFPKLVAVFSQTISNLSSRFSRVLWQQFLQRRSICSALIEVLSYSSQQGIVSVSVLYFRFSRDASYCRISSNCPNANNFLYTMWTYVLISQVYFDDFGFQYSGQPTKRLHVGQYSGILGFSTTTRIFAENIE